MPVRLGPSPLWEQRTEVGLARRFRGDLGVPQPRHVPWGPMPDGVALPGVTSESKLPGRRILYI